jgi:hypothetical protein
MDNLQALPPEAHRVDFPAPLQQKATMFGFVRFARRSMIALFHGQVRNRLEIKPLSMTLEQTYGSVAPLNQPEDFEALHHIVRDEREDRWLNS